MDPTIFQAAVTAVVTSALEQISINGANSGGSGNGTGSSNQGDNQRQPKECTHKDFVKCKPKPLNGRGGAITLTRWF